MKETHYKLKHRVTALFAAAVMLCSMLPGAAFAEEPTPQPTEETVQMEQQTEPSETDNGQTDESSPDPGEDVTEATPETAEEQPAEEEIPAAVVGAELYTDLPNAPIGSYIGSEGLPVATGETKIGISEWPESQLEETSGSYRPPLHWTMTVLPWPRPCWTAQTMPLFLLWHRSNIPQTAAAPT